MSQIKDKLACNKKVVHNHLTVTINFLTIINNSLTVTINVKTFQTHSAKVIEIR